jgi:hypothetical protein
MSRGKQIFQLRELLAIDDLYFARSELRHPILYSARGEVIHFCRVGIAHRREPPRPKTVGDAHPTMAHSAPRRV